jgi:hypothetical protein
MSLLKDNRLGVRRLLLLALGFRLPLLVGRPLPCCDFV